MTAPRLEIDLSKIEHNARMLVNRLAPLGVTVTGITKATLGSQEIASAMLKAGVSGIGDSHIENIIRMGDICALSPMTLIRAPMLSQADQAVTHADISFNSELSVIVKLSSAAQRANKTHGVVIMVELGDLREGVMPCDLMMVVEETRRLPNILFKGIGANLACLNGVAPDASNMRDLSSLADSIDLKFGPITDIVSGGNSANIEWALSGVTTGRINNLRLGEAILFGREALHRKPIDGLYTDAITLVAEVIETKVKPSLPWGEIAENAFGESLQRSDCGATSRTILAIGRQDIDPAGLKPPLEFEIIGTSSDHLLLDTGSDHVSVGGEVTFQINYSAFLRAMTSPFVSQVLIPQAGHIHTKQQTLSERPSTPGPCQSTCASCRCADETA